MTKCGAASCDLCGNTVTRISRAPHFVMLPSAGRSDGKGTSHGQAPEAGHGSLDEGQGRDTRRPSHA